MAKKNPICKKKDKAHFTHSFKKNANNFYNHVENGSLDGEPVGCKCLEVFCVKNKSSEFCSC